MLQLQRNYFYQRRNYAQSLLQKVENSPEADESIKNIAKEFAVFANTEQIKFQRGDYLS